MRRHEPLINRQTKQLAQVAHEIQKLTQAVRDNTAELMIGSLLEHSTTTPDFQTSPLLQIAMFHGPDLRADIDDNSSTATTLLLRGQDLDIRITATTDLQRFLDAWSEQAWRQREEGPSDSYKPTQGGPQLSLIKSDGTEQGRNHTRHLHSVGPQGIA